jgi:2-C-methyl-D-erythritol 4-phosphate cytidylyltransferase
MSTNIRAPRVGAIVVAAGSGSRLGMGSKALVELNGKTVLAWSLELFLQLDEIDQIVVPGPEGRLEAVRREVQALRPRKPVLICSGGQTRQQSVRAGLGELVGCDFVLVHDAARPLASPALARRVLAAAVESEAAIPGLPPRDAVKRVEGGRMVESLDRSRLVLAQTPQGFAYQLFERAHFEAADAGVVGDDDGQLVAASGHPVTVVEGEPTNIKLTTLDDLPVLRAILAERDAAAAGESAAETARMVGTRAGRGRPR